MDFFPGYMLSLFYIATFYKRVMKCCFLGIKNLQVQTTYKFFIPT